MATRGTDIIGVCTALVLSFLYKNFGVGGAKLSTSVRDGLLNLEYAERTMADEIQARRSDSLGDKPIVGDLHCLLV